MLTSMSPDFPRALSLSLSHPHVFFSSSFSHFLLSISPSPNPFQLNLMFCLPVHLPSFLPLLLTHTFTRLQQWETESLRESVCVSVCACVWRVPRACGCVRHPQWCENLTEISWTFLEFEPFSQASSSRSSLWHFHPLWMWNTICVFALTHTHFLQRVRAFVCVRHSSGITSSNTASVSAPRASPEWCAKWTEMSQHNGRLQLSLCSHAPLRVSVCLHFSFLLAIRYENRAADADKPMSEQSASKCLMEICSADGYVPFLWLRELVILLNHNYSV